MVTISGGSDEGSRDKVSQYNLQGWVRDLPQLQQGRWSRGCGQYLNDDNDRARYSNFDKVLNVILDLLGNRWPHHIHIHRI